MRAVFGIVLVIGLGLAGFAVYMVQGYFQQQQVALARERAVLAQQVPTVEVIAVNRAIGYGEQITKDDVKAIRYAEPFLPEGVFRTMEDLFSEGDDTYRVVLRPMENNEPILAIKVTEPGADAGLTTRLAPGMRAFAIRVDVASGVSGFLRPGDRVDVYWTGSLNGSSREVTKLIETGIKLVAVDQTDEMNLASAAIARTVTVEVSPQQVANLAQAQSTGSLSLALVGATDETTPTAIEVDLNTLLGITPEAAPTPEAVAPAERVCTIKTRRGADVVEIPIPCSN